MLDKMIELYEDAMDYLLVAFILGLCLMLLALVGSVLWGQMHPKEFSQIAMAKDVKTIQRVLDEMNK